MLSFLHSLGKSYRDNFFFVFCFLIYSFLLIMPFSTGIGLERVGVVRPDLDRWWAGLQAPGSSGLRQDRCNVGLQVVDVTLFCKNKEEGGSARASPVAAPMLKSDSFWENRETA